MNFAVGHTHSRARTVHCNVAAADNHKVSGEGRSLTFYDAAFNLKKKIQAVVIAFNLFIVLGESKFHTLGTADPYKNSIKSLVKKVI